MIEPRDCIIDGLDGGRFRLERASQHYDGDAECARGGDLAVAWRATAVLGYDGIDSMVEEQRAVIRFAERAPPSHIGRLRQRQRRIDRIDAADQIKVLRRLDERREFAAPQRNEDAARPTSQHVHGVIGIGRFFPAVAIHGGPRRPADRNEGNARFARGSAGVGRHDVRIRMRCIDHRIDPLFDEIIRKPGGAAEAAAADRHGLWSRRHGTAGERQHDLKVGALGQPLGQTARFGGAAEDEDA